jgi:hypothetical protein
LFIQDSGEDMSVSSDNEDFVGNAFEDEDFHMDIAVDPVGENNLNPGKILNCLNIETKYYLKSDI